MSFIADLHIHSHFSLATSRDLVPEQLHLWGRKKGIQLIGTGDFTHPGWLAELAEKLEPAGNGFYRLKREYELPESKLYAGEGPYFVLTAEISNIYKKNGKVRKVHNILISPDVETCTFIQAKLISGGFNIRSDGRPILGLDSQDLFDMVLNINPAVLLIPAHIWTPWFSALGASSGFDSIAECYGTLTSLITAVETGLSSDVPMNRIISQLDAFTLISNSDAHSPEKLGRNATIFYGEMNWPGLVNCLKDGHVKTIDLFPQEGKYHYAGHRKCGVVLDPVEAMRHGGVCPVCHRRLTPGVMDRVVELSDRTHPGESPRKQEFSYIIPLPELLGGIYGVSAGTKQVATQYQQIIRNVSPELPLLFDMDTGEIARRAGPVLAEAIGRMRRKEVIITEGYDGEYGVIKVFNQGEAASWQQTSSLFGGITNEHIVPERPLLNFDLDAYFELKRLKKAGISTSTASEPELSYQAGTKNREQHLAAIHAVGPAMVIAGPGTGKTRVFTMRIAHLIKDAGISPGNILAVTFTNKASGEISSRLENLLGKTVTDQLNIGTFHATGLRILTENPEAAGRRAGFAIINDAERKNILNEHFGVKATDTEKISLYKNGALNLLPDDDLIIACNAYNHFLKQANLFDFDDLVAEVNLLFEHHPEILEVYRERFRYLLVDEFQDVNPAQYTFLKHLCNPETRNIFVIGDPNQSIYGFRGASPRFIDRFYRDYKPVTTYKLSTSYRCSDVVLKASANVIGQQDFVSGLDKGLKIKIVGTQTDKSEAEFIARSIDESLGGTRFFAVDSGVATGQGSGSLAETAILCRTTRQFDVICKALNDHAIPWQLARHGNPFETGLPAKIALLLKALVNPSNAWASEQFYTITGNYPDAGFISPDADIVQIIRKITTTYNLSAQPDDGQAMADLLETAAGFGKDFQAFLTFVDLETGSSYVSKRPDAVNLLTLHASKGLEFEQVYIAGCNDRLLPYRLFKGQESDVEEEKRLLYVGMTRARKQLYLTHAARRNLFNMHLVLERSPFIDQIEKELIVREKQEMKPRTGSNQLELF
jgi:uncharacterized protein (TIGR00375 family)